MASKKQETAIKTAVTREKKRGIVREERHILWILLAIIFILLYLLWAQGSGWWPFAQPKLGTAFYTNIPAASSGSEAAKDASSSSGTKSNGSTSTGNGSSSTGSNSGGNSGSGSTTPSSSNSIADLAAGVNVGDTKTKISGSAKNLGAGCSVIVSANAKTGGKQEVCTYTQGDKIVTVTYLNDRVISASKSGF